MNAKEIKEYLGTLVELEKEKYMQERLISRTGRHIRQLGKPEDIPVPQRNYKETSSEDPFAGAQVGAMFGAVIGGIVGLFIFDNGFFGSILLGAIVGAACLAIVVQIISSVSDSISDTNARTEADKEYQEEYKEYIKRKEKDNLRLEEEQRARIYLVDELQQLNSSYSLTVEVLDKLYGMGILYEKYRHNFPAVASLYEYFSSGRFTALEGPDGAYNQLELEIRLDRITTRLDIIINQLEAIKQNQFMIYTAISEANSKLDQLIESSNRIEADVRNIKLQGDELNARVAGLQATSELNMYINALNHRELSYIRQYDLN